MKPLELDVALLALQQMPILLGLSNEPMWCINDQSTDNTQTRTKLKHLFEKRIEPVTLFSFISALFDHFTR